MIPEFQKDGNLPKGLYEATLHEVRDVFGTGSARRKLLIKNFENIVELAKSTGKLERVIVWGSFVSKKRISPGYRLAPNNANPYPQIEGRLGMDALEKALGVSL